MRFPELFEKIDDFRGREPSRETFLVGLELIQSFRRYEIDLTNWLVGYQASMGKPIYRPKLSTMQNAADSPVYGKVFPVAFYFPSFTAATIMVTFWDMQVIMYCHVCLVTAKLSTMADELDAYTEEQISSECSPFNSTVDAGISSDCSLGRLRDLIPALGHRAEWPRTAASFICQSVEYFFQKEMGDVGPLSCFSHLNVIWTCLAITPGDWTRELAWISYVMSLLQTKSRLAAFLKDVEG